MLFTFETLRQHWSQVLRCPAALHTVAEWLVHIPLGTRPGHSTFLKDKCRRLASAAFGFRRVPLGNNHLRATATSWSGTFRPARCLFVAERPDNSLPPTAIQRHGLPEAELKSYTGLVLLPNFALQPTACSLFHQ